MNHVVVGFGEIGQAIHSLLEGDVFVIDPVLPEDKTPDRVDIMHVCFPYSVDFVNEVMRYINELTPQHVIIYSTTQVGTVAQIPKAVHSPVEGKHPELALSVQLMERWIGYNNKEEGLFFADFFATIGLKTKLVPDTNFTEALKLISTTEYGINIEFARYKNFVAESLGMSYELTKEWNEAYNRLYKDLGMEKRFQKFVLDPPTGPKGGHCVTPNARLLNEQFPNTLVEIVGEL